MPITGSFPFNRKLAHAAGRTVPMIEDLREVTDSNDPGSVNLSLKGGKAKMSYWWTSTNVDDFHTMARLILGQANVADSTRPAAIARLMPLGHPRFPTLYAETITDFAGLGAKFTKEASFDYTTIRDAIVAGGTAIAPNFPQYARYPEYRIDIEFSNRLYTLIPDAALDVPASLSWSDQKWDTTLNGGNGGFADDPKQCWDTFEYQRYTWVTGGPKESWITAKAGQAGIDVGTGANKTKLFLDQIKAAMPDGAVVIRWFEVPYSFVRPSTPVDPSGASWLQLFQGRINQLPFLSWQPGDLLYVTSSPKPYKSPIPTSDGYLTTLCDIDLIFLETKRLLATGDDATPAALASWLKAGWNLNIYWIDKLFHYTHSHQGVNPTTGAPIVLSANQQTPPFRSFPIQILFSDPSVALPP